MNKKIIITISSLISFVLIVSFFVFYRFDYSDDSNILGVSKEEVTDQSLILWNSALSNFESISSQYSSKGIIEGSVERFGATFEFTIEFESVVNENNRDIRIFSSNEEMNLKYYNSSLYLSENDSLNNWFKLDVSQQRNNVNQEISINNLSDLVQLEENLDMVIPTHQETEACGEDICYVFHIQPDEQTIEIIVQEERQEIIGMRRSLNGINVMISISSSDEIVTEPQNITQLNQSDTEQIVQSKIRNVVMESIFT